MEKWNKKQAAREESGRKTIGKNGTRDVQAENERYEKNKRKKLEQKRKLEKKKAKQ